MCARELVPGLALLRSERGPELPRDVIPGSCAPRCSSPRAWGTQRWRVCPGSPGCNATLVPPLLNFLLWPSQIPHRLDRNLIADAISSQKGQA
jgi:hypothetical protein